MKIQLKSLQKYLKYAGLPLVYAGVLELVTIYIGGWTSYDFLLFLGLFLIVAGIIGYIADSKRGSRY